MQKSKLLIIFLIVFLDLVGFGIVIPILPYYAQSFGASAWQLGWVMSIYSLMQFFFSPIWGTLSDRIGRRPVLLSTLIGGVLSLLFLAQAKTLIWIFVGRMLAGFFGANISTAYAYIADITDESNRSKGMGIIGAGFGLGFIFGPAIGGILSRHGYAAPMYFAAGLSLINIIFAYFKLTEPESTREFRSKNRTKRFDFKNNQAVLKNFKLNVVISTFFLVTLSVTQMEVVFALYFRHFFNFNSEQAGWILALMGVSMVLVQGGLIGKVSKRFGENTLIPVSIFCCAVSLVFFSFSNTLSFSVFFLVILSFSNGFLSPSLSSLVSKLAPPDLKGTTLGVYQSAGSLARVIGPPLAGFLFDHKGPKAPFMASSLILIFSLIFFTLLLKSLNRPNTSRLT